MNWMPLPEPWLNALIGGLLIGAAAALLFVANGRIAGISGIFGGLILERVAGDRLWRALFLAGLLTGPLWVRWAGWDQPVVLVAGGGATLLAGLLVGFGTRLGSGCTSGHGICGVARFSVRSIAATALFMAMGMLTVFALRHWGQS